MFPPCPCNRINTLPSSAMSQHHRLLTQSPQQWRLQIRRRIQNSNSATAITPCLLPALPGILQLQRTRKKEFKGTMRQSQHKTRITATSRKTHLNSLKANSSWITLTQLSRTRQLEPSISSNKLLERTMQFSRSSKQEALQENWLLMTAKAQILT